MNVTATRAKNSLQTPNVKDGLGPIGDLTLLRLI
jgi:hypothetical protein